MELSWISPSCSTRLITFYLPLIFHLTQSHSNGYMKPRDVECYSCMSNYYAPFWAILSEVYLRPIKFDDECESPSSSSKTFVTVRCRSVCVVVREDLYASGISMKRSGFIRGCLDSLVKRPNRFNESALDLHRLVLHPSCRVVDISQLLVGPNQQQSKLVSICTCSHSHCESQVNSATIFTPLLTLYAIGWLFTRLPIISGSTPS